MALADLGTVRTTVPVMTVPVMTVPVTAACLRMDSTRRTRCCSNPLRHWRFGRCARLQARRRQRSVSQQRRRSRRLRCRDSGGEAVTRGSQPLKRRGHFDRYPVLPMAVVRSVVRGSRLQPVVEAHRPAAPRTGAAPAQEVPLAWVVGLAWVVALARRPAVRRLAVAQPARRMSAAAHRAHPRAGLALLVDLREVASHRQWDRRSSVS
jgi:hypothetical protein